MAASTELREADQAARIAILNKIAKEVDAGSYNIVQLAQAYNYVTQSAAPHDPEAKSRVGGFA